MTPISTAAPPDQDHNAEVKTTIARMQLTDHLAGREVACGKCKIPRPMHSQYRCRWCGVWYCHACGAEHFKSDATHHEPPSR